MTKSASPYLIQRGTIRGDFTGRPLSKAVNLDYMGSAEFEFGALPASLKALRVAKDRLAATEVEIVRDHRGRPLIVYGDLSGIDMDHYRSALVALAAGQLRTLEWSRLTDQITLPEVHVPSRYRTKAQRQEYIADHRVRMTNFWWDITNNVMFSFEPDFMAALPGVLEASWSVMDENARQSA